MQISLVPFGPPMWHFLTSTGECISLTIAKPGPFTINFDSLTHDEQYYIINSIRAQQISSDTTVDFLLQCLEAKEKPSVQPVVPVPQESVPVQPVVTPEIQQSIEQKIAQSQAKQKEIFDKRLERGFYVLSQNASLIRSEFGKELDMPFLKALVQKELETKKRKSVLKFLRERIALVQRHKVSQIESTDYIVRYQPAREPKMTVSESEKELILVGVQE